MLKESTHIFWEWMGVLEGIALIIMGILLLIKARKKQKLIKRIGYFSILLGIATVIVDGFIFLPSRS